MFVSSNDLDIVWNMSLVTEESGHSLVYLTGSSPQPHPSSQGDTSGSETAGTDNASPSQRQPVVQKISTVTGTVCAVCSEMSGKDSVFRKHYGVVCCEACKCFFRRTVQMSRDYKCRYDGRCTIGRFTDNMKQVCQACRFSQCIRAGMKIDCKSIWCLLPLCVYYSWYVSVGISTHCTYEIL